jgi:hypothetical protein
VERRADTGIGLCADHDETTDLPAGKNGLERGARPSAGPIRQGPPSAVTSRPACRCWR